MKIHIPDDLYPLAKQKQLLYSSRGINKSMFDCAVEVCYENDSRVPNLKSIERELKKISSHFDGSSFNKRKGGGWLG